MTGFITSLGDGTSVHLRPVIPEDRGRIANGARHLSPDSRYFRFFDAQSAMGGDLLHHLTHVDQQDHVAWMALIPRITGDAALGVGRFIRDARVPTRAEVALTVIDSWQHRGMGTLLMALLCCVAETKGIQAFYASVLPENRLMIEWFLRIGAEENFEDGICAFHFDVPVASRLEEPAAHHTELHSAILKIRTAMRNSIQPPPHRVGKGNIATNTSL